MVIQAPPAPKNPFGPNRPSPVANISKIACLRRYDNKDYALDILHDLAKAVGPIMHEYNFKIGMLCEMYPKNPLLLGLNVNKGQKILIRLRPPYAEHAFYPMSDLVGTMLHELAHNVHGPHDAKFYAFLDELRTRFERGDFAASDYVCEEYTLGSRYTAPWQTSKTVRQKRLEALSKGKYKAESRRLGGSKKLPAEMREAMLKAAEQRIKDSKWCPLGEDGIVDLSELQEVDFSDAASGASKSEKIKEYKEVVDLTQEEAKEGAKDDDDKIEIIEVDACETPTDPNTLWADKLRPPLGSESQFGSGKFKVGEPPQIHYTISTSPGKTFIGDELQYPRRKMVANLDFKQIIEKGDQIASENKKKLIDQRKSTPEKGKRLHSKEEVTPTEKYPKAGKDSRKVKRARAKSEKSPSVDGAAQKERKKLDQKTVPKPDQKPVPKLDRRKELRLVSFEELLNL